MLFFWTLYSLKNPDTNVSVSSKILSRKNVLNINKKCFWKFSFAITLINYIIKYVLIEKLFLNCNIIAQYYSHYCIFIKEM